MILFQMRFFCLTSIFKLHPKYVDLWYQQVISLLTCMLFKVTTNENFINRVTCRSKYVLVFRQVNDFLCKQKEVYSQLLNL